MLSTSVKSGKGDEKGIENFALFTKILINKYIQLYTIRNGSNLLLFTLNILTFIY